MAVHDYIAALVTNLQPMHISILSLVISFLAFAMGYFGQRASVYFQPTGFVRTIDRTGQRVWRLQVNMGNAGNTAARRLRYQLDCTDGTPEPGDPFDRLRSAESIDYCLGPRVLDQGILLDKAFAEAELRALDPGSIVYLFGRAQYRDLFFRKQTTEFCFELSDIVFHRDASKPNDEPSPYILRVRPCKSGHNRT